LSIKSTKSESKDVHVNFSSISSNDNFKQTHKYQKEEHDLQPIFPQSSKVDQPNHAKNNNNNNIYNDTNKEILSKTTSKNNIDDGHNLNNKNANSKNDITLSNTPVSSFFSTTAASQNLNAFNESEKKK